MTIRKSALVLAIALTTAQLTAQTAPTIDGSEHPEQVPTGLAWRMIIESLWSTKKQPMSRLDKRARLSFGCADDRDRDVIIDAADRLRKQVDRFEAEARLTLGGLPHAVPGSREEARLRELYQSQEDAFSQAIEEAQRGLSAEGGEKMAQYVELAKRQIKVYGTPEYLDRYTAARPARLMNVQFGGCSCSGMLPSGSYYQIVGFDAHGNIQGSTVTDGNSSCYCHTVTASAQLYSPNNRTAFTTSSAKNWTEATATLPFLQSDIGNYTLTGYPTAYCPVCGCYFIFDVYASMDFEIGEHFFGYVFSGKDVSGHCVYVRCNVPSPPPSGTICYTFSVAPSGFNPPGCPKFAVVQWLTATVAGYTGCFELNYARATDCLPDR